jgi:hypothetical protein
MGKINIGDEDENGIVFWVDENGEHGLIAAKKDISGEADWNEAMEFCNEYKIGGYDNWRLPTDEELNLLFLQKDLVGGFVRFSYWSATEYAAHFAFFQHFLSGERDNDFKDNTCYVRAIRSF